MTCTTLTKPYRQLTRSSTYVTVTGADRMCHCLFQGWQWPPIKNWSNSTFSRYPPKKLTNGTKKNCNVQICMQNFQNKFLGYGSGLHTRGYTP